MEQLIKPIGHIGLCNADRAKDVILKLECESFGDSLCSTPTLRKLAESYGKKIIVCSYKPFIFENNPYVKFHIHSKDFKEEFREQYEVLETFQLGGSQSLKLNGMSVKYGSVDIRRIHCTNLGFDLRPNEMHCEYHPGPINFEESDESFLNSGSYIVIHVSRTWPSRTWSQSNYENLIKNINKAGYKVALIGFDTPKEAFNDYSKDCYDLDHLEFDGVSFLNRTSLDQDFEIIKKANICITCDTGILHLAGCTDTEIIYIGGSIDPIFRAPYRHGGQDYKFSFVGGECKIFCGSDPKYCITEHAKLNALPQVSVCLEQKPTFECHPTHEQVFKKIAEVNLRNLKESDLRDFPPQKKDDDLERVVLVDLGSSALGDTLAWMPYVEEYRLKNNCKIHCSTFKNELFEKSYPKINFIEPGSVVDCDEVIQIGWTKDEETGQLRPPADIRWRSLQETASFCLGLENHRERKPKIHIEDKQKKIEGKYVCIATQSTNQTKYWNNEEGWGKTVEYLQSLGYKVVCIDKHRSFGIEGQWNLIPEGAIDKTGDLPLQERITDLYNCEFFVGLPSGLSWLAWTLDKEVVMISGFSDPKTEFYTPHRVINTQVCNSCFNKEEFCSEGDWNWCPYHEGTEREYECTKEITFEDVKVEIDKVVNFVDLEKKGYITIDGLTQNVLKLGDKIKTLEGIRDQWGEIFMKRIYELFSPIEKGDVVLDIGANVGLFSAFAMWREASKCYSIEPVSYNFKILTNWMETSKNRDKFFPINKAIADKPLSEESLMNGNKEDCSKIEIIKLSDFFKKHPSENFDFIKMDCEGGEWSVLNDKKELDLLIEKTKKLAMELHLRLGWEENTQTFDFNFDFANEFINRGFDIKFTDVFGEDITRQILNNEKLADQNDLLAYDYYRQIMFFAKKTTISRRVLVDLGSSALGDTLAWIPYVEEYRSKNNCKVYCSTFKNELFKKSYPEINFIEPGGEVADCNEVIEVGFSKAPLHIMRRSLQEIGSFCLGSENHQERKPKVDIEDKGRKIEGKYVCIAIQSTAQAKYWNNKEGWNKVVKYLKLLGYKVVCIDKDCNFGAKEQWNLIPEGVIDKTGDFSLQERITDIHNCEFFIGLSSGLSWLAWALDKEVVMISGFTNPSNEFFTPYRPINKDVCHGCYHEEKFDRDNWNWCPYHEGTEREFECTKEITFEMVKEKIDKLI